MYIDIVPNRNSPPAVLLREGWREGGKVRKRTLANLSMLPPEAIEALRCVLRGEKLVAAGQHLRIERSLPHGGVAAVVGVIKKLGLHTIVGSRRSAQRERVLAMIAARVLDPASRLALARQLDPATASSTLGEVLGVEGVTPDQLYTAMDWLLARKERIEKKLARRHLSQGTLLLYDVTSIWLEGRTCPLAAFGYNRDGKKGKMQIVVGLLCTPQGCPVSVEVYSGNTADCSTLACQIAKVRKRWGLHRVVWVGDRGLLTEARINEELRPVEGLDWITALRSSAIRKLVEEQALQLSLFDEQDLVEFRSTEYPGERLVGCRNPLLAGERARKREDLLLATEDKLETIAAATRRAKRPLRGQDKIALRVGKVLGKYKVGKHFDLEITEQGFTWQRNAERIAAEARLDGVYVIRSSVSSQAMQADGLVQRYKELSRIEQAFRSLKTLHLDVRPIHHRLTERVQAHVFICMLAYYVSWHMRQALAPILFAEDDPQGAAAERDSPVAPAQRSSRAKKKAAIKRNKEGFPVHSLQTLLTDLSTLTKNRVQFGQVSFDQLASPTPLQQKAFELLGVTWRR